MSADKTHRNDIDDPDFGFDEDESGPDRNEWLGAEIYDCDRCVDEFGSSVELVVLGRTDPSTICAVHPKNTAMGFTLRKDAEGKPLEMPLGTLDISFDRAKIQKNSHQI